MLNPIFHNGTATIKFDEEFRDVDGNLCVQENILHQNIPVQICCYDGRSGVSCGITKSQDKELSIKIHPQYALPTGKNRVDLMIDIEDCFGELGKFKSDDYHCITFPLTGVHSYKINLTYIDG